MTPISRTRVKICGITRPEDGATAAGLGADAIGLVFHPASPRFVDADAARRIIAALPPFITVVGLFRNDRPAMVRAILATVPLHLLQFHGDEEPEECAAFGLPYLKAVPMGAGPDVRDYERRFATAAALLLDSHGGNTMGGTGERFDWSRIPAERRKPLILAGGLDSGNVAAAIRQVGPYAVDVSSGVETAKGIKDAELMRAFLRGVYECESPAR
ncbi:MAG TPA: phosphoribosylanthranilate isomerase [Candidatus Competibacter sp.]|nr:phosphoribosylanthranilate isomerase [Candidatus Competibacteraceae bacterium]HRC73529.1 phosphoribosylanthranilate isomerase [Candidatus Competibacter sp.]